MASVLCSSRCHAAAWETVYQEILQVLELPLIAMFTCRGRVIFMSPVGTCVNATDSLFECKSQPIRQVICGILLSTTQVLVWCLDTTPIKISDINEHIPFINLKSKCSSILIESISNRTRMTIVIFTLQACRTTASIRTLTLRPPKECYI